MRAIDLRDAELVDERYGLEELAREREMLHD